MKRIFVYGTLKRGYYWHRIIPDATFIEDKVISGYKLVRFAGNGVFYVPVMLHTGDDNDKVKGEVLEIDDQTFERVLQLEHGYSHVKLDDNTSMFIADKDADIYNTALALHEVAKNTDGVYEYVN